ncbi:hypothetical protein GT755_12385 [Herbidospora sp. NEAU-GS84]|uniref:Uncharacterized protein n=1 Tax=Herbidospora solisilvae TaxID=2696284 RepID=A0A7C9J341_9ACTN|nr:hypothetical protein [Herbidospora solisilvae]NAS22480.1 hypothetical protein [Herbidospora solisilvae]
MGADLSRQARTLRLFAAALRGKAVQCELAANMVETAAGFQAIRRVCAAADLAEIVAHPDLAYLDLQTRGFYDHG